MSDVDRRPDRSGGTGGNSDARADSSAGTLTLAGASTYTSATTVNAGTLRVNGSTAPGSAVTLASGGTLGGSGTINGTATVNSGGTLAPVTSPGVINTGNLSLSSGSTLADRNNNGTTPGSGYDQVNVTGSVALGGATLALTVSGFTLTSGQCFTIVNNDAADGIGGTFSGLAQGATFPASLHIPDQLHRRHEQQRRHADGPQRVPDADDERLRERRPRRIPSMTTATLMAGEPDGHYHLPALWPGRCDLRRRPGVRERAGVGRRQRQLRLAGLQPDRVRRTAGRPRIPETRITVASTVCNAANESVTVSGLVRP